MDVLSYQVRIPHVLCILTNVCMTQITGEMNILQADINDVMEKNRAIHENGKSVS